MEEAEACARADDAARAAIAAEAEAKKQHDEKSQKRMDMFVYTSKDVGNLLPNAPEFKIVLAWHEAGIEINREELLTKKVAISSLREEASRKCEEEDYEEAERLQAEASKCILRREVGSRCSLSNSYV